MIAIMEPPINFPPIVVAGNYEPDSNAEGEIICPYCHRASGWNRDLWEFNPPEGGFYCNSCGENFLTEGVNNDE
jgi:hypothetical protein